jgi:hypothetical protein
MDKMKNPAVVGAGQYDGNGADELSLVYGVVYAKGSDGMSLNAWGSLLLSSFHHSRDYLVTDSVLLELD